MFYDSHFISADEVITDGLQLKRLIRKDLDLRKLIGKTSK